MNQFQVLQNYVINTDMKIEGGIQVAFISIQENSFLYLCNEKDCPDKKYMLRLFKESVPREFIVNEINMSQFFRFHENFLRLLNHFEFENQHVLIYEYCFNEELRKYLARNKNILDEKERVKIFMKIVSAIKKVQDELKQVDMIFLHKNLSSDIILLDENLQIKLIGLGDAEIQYSEEYFPLFKHALFGTPNYLDPAMLNYEGFNKKSDLWSLGIILYEILFNERPYDQNQILSQMKGSSKMKKCYQQLIIIFTGNQHLIGRAISEPVKNLLNNLLKVKVQERYSWDDLFNDPLVKEYVEPNQLSINLINQSEIEVFKKKSLKLSNFQLNQIILKDDSEEIQNSELNTLLLMMIYHGTVSALASDKLDQLNFELLKLKPEMNDEEEDRPQCAISDWMTYEKCVYLLYFRAYTMMTKFLVMMTLKVPEFSDQSIDQSLWQLLTQEDKKTIYDRIHFMIYIVEEETRFLFQVNYFIDIISRVLECYQDQTIQLINMEIFLVLRKGHVFPIGWEISQNNLKMNNLIRFIAKSYSKF